LNRLAYWALRGASSGVIGAAGEDGIMPNLIHRADRQAGFAPISDSLKAARGALYQSH
jgi:hypothetical protein